MWVSIVGACGTGKHSVLKMLEKDGYEFIPTNSPAEIAPGFDLEFSHACERLRVQVQAQKIMNKKNVVTVHTFWETQDVYVPIALKKDQLTYIEVARLTLMHNTFKEILEPPHAMIYIQSEKMNAFNRMSLRQQTVSQDDFNEQIRLFDEFVKKIRIPVVEIDGNRTPDQIKKDLEFGVASLKASTVGSQSFWNREFFR